MVEPVKLPIPPHIKPSAAPSNAPLFPPVIYPIPVPTAVLTATLAITGKTNPPVATVTPTAATVGTAPIATLAQFGNEKYPFSSYRPIGSFEHYVYKF